MTINDLTQAQIGKETTWGTTVTPTAKLMGIESFDITPIVDTEVKKDIRGSQAPGYNAVVLKAEAQAEFSGQALYEDLPYWLESLMGVVTPTGAGPYVRTGNAPVSNTGVASPRMMTVIMGDANDAYKLGGGIVSDLTLSFEANKPAMVKGKMLGQAVTSGAALAGLSDRSVNVIMGDHLTLYIDAWGGTVGTTVIAASAFAGELTLKSNRKLRHYLGALTPGNWNDPRWEGSLKLTVEFNTTTKAYLNSLLTPGLVQHQVRLKFASGANLIQQLDFAGNLTKAPKIYDDRDGLSTIDLEYDGQYNTALANWLKYSNTNNVSALP